MSLDIITVVRFLVAFSLSRSLQCRCLVGVSPGPVLDMQRAEETCREGHQTCRAELSCEMTCREEQRSMQSDNRGPARHQESGGDCRYEPTSPDTDHGTSDDGDTDPHPGILRGSLNYL